jgi:hypothetical protein
MSEQSSQEAANTPKPPDVGGRAQRRSRWASSKEAINQIIAAFGSNDVRVRQSDRVTSILLYCSIAAGTVFFLYPSQFAPMVWLCDILFATTIIFYIAQRLGIFSTFNQRQTLLAAELMFGLAVLGVLLAFNVAAILSCAKEVVINSMPH